jgi:hypothetical protein
LQYPVSIDRRFLPILHFIRFIKTENKEKRENWNEKMDNEQCAEDEITKAFHQVSIFSTEKKMSFVKKFIPLAITLTLILCPLILWQLLIFLSPPRLSDQFGRPIIPVKKDKTFSALYENSTGISNGG